MTIGTSDDTPTLPPSMRDRVPYLLYRAATSSTALADAYLKQVGLTARQVGILTLIVEVRPMRQHRLGEMLGIDRTTVVALIDDLEAKHLVQRRRDLTDRRAFEIHPTAKGVAAQKLAVTVLDEMAAEFLAPLSHEQRAQLAMLLRLLEPRLH